MQSFLSWCLSQWKGVFTLLTAFLSTFFGLHAQSGEAIYQGTWLANTPDRGNLILIIKRDGRAAYFWGENTDLNVYQGRWTQTDDIATITWEDESQHILKQVLSGPEITHKDSQGNEQYTVPIQQPSKDTLGQWAKPPSNSEVVTSDGEKAKNFFGCWRIGENSRHFIFIEADRSAASTWVAGTSDDRGLRGSWVRQGSELHIIWDSGHYSILRKGEKGFTYKRIEPGAIIETNESKLVPATRTSKKNVSGTWLELYEKEKLADGIPFTSRKKMRQFYLGTWLVQHNKESFEKIEIGRFGGLSTSQDPSLKGNWLIKEQDIFMRWDTGMRKILSPIGRGFVLYTYKSGQPVDGIPTSVLPTTPLNRKKLDAYLKGNEAIAEEMLGLSKATDISSQKQQNGWHHSFRRWIWPFGHDTPLPEDFEAIRSTPIGQPPSNEHSNLQKGIDSNP